MFEHGARGFSFGYTNQHEMLQVGDSTVNNILRENCIVKGVCKLDVIRIVKLILL